MHAGQFLSLHKLNYWIGTRLFRFGSPRNRRVTSALIREVRDGYPGHWSEQITESKFMKMFSRFPFATSLKQSSAGCVCEVPDNRRRSVAVWLNLGSGVGQFVIAATKTSSMHLYLSQHARDHIHATESPERDTITVNYIIIYKLHW